jgi:dihydroorotase
VNNQSQLLKQVRFIDPVAQLDRVVDVWLADGKIQRIEPNIALVPAAEEIDAQGLILAPGAIDLYSSSGEPGFEARENLTSLMAAAEAGGFTRLNILPNTNPPLDNRQILNWLKDKSLPASATCKVNFWGAVTHDLAGQQMTELAEMVDGVIGFADGYPLEDWSLLVRLLEYAQPLGKPIGLVANSPKLRGKGVMREGETSMRLGLAGDPSLSETAALAALLEVIAETNTPVHIMRLSTRRGIELVAQAKQRGLPITASTTWMHLLFDTEDLVSYDVNLCLQPPLGSPSDKLASIEGVKCGVIDGIAIDHTPYTYEEKTVAFADAPPGVIGLELALSILWQRFVATEKWTAVELWQALSTRPAICLGEKPITCNIGDRAELVLFDPQAVWRVDRQNLRSFSDNTPWLGQEIVGRVVRVWNSANNT